jgi:hypothetical protein
MFSVKTDTRVNSTENDMNTEKIKDNQLLSKELDNEYYKYNALSQLNNNFDEINYDDIDTITICPYFINLEGKNPFLQFGLISDGETLNFITLPVSPIKPENLINCTGYLLKNRNLFLLNKIHNMSMEYYFLTKISIQWLVLVDEIMNHKHVCNIPINNDVIQFFDEHVEMLFLETQNGDIHELPSVAYYGTNGENTQFIANIGVPIESHTKIMGPYFYFTTCENAIKDSIYPTNEYLSNPRYNNIIDKNNKYKKNSLFRFALFLGKMKVPLNHPDDPNDNSLLKKQKLSDKDSEHEAKMTLRITDYDGIWTESYDSVYIGDIELDDGSKLKDKNMWVIKNFDDHTFLSTHIINKKNENIV